MRFLALLAVMLSVAGCDEEAASHQPQAGQKEAPAYPEKVTALIKLVEQLEPGTNEHDWIQLVDRAIGLPDDDLLWLSRDRITGHRRRFWILLPDELDDPKTTKQFYEDICQTESSIRIEGLCRIGDKTLAYVEDYGGNSRLLNSGVHTGEIEMRPIASRFHLMLLDVLNLPRGISPFLKHTAITPKCKP